MFLLTSAVIVCCCAVRVTTDNVITKFQMAEPFMEITVHDEVCPKGPILYLEHLIGDCIPERLATCLLQIATIFSAEVKLGTRRRIYINEVTVGRILPLLSNVNLPVITIIPSDCEATRDVNWDENSFAGKDVKEYSRLLDELKGIKGNGAIFSPPIVYSCIADNLTELKRSFPIQRGIKIMLDRMLTRYEDTFIEINSGFSGKTTFVGVRARRRIKGIVAGPEYFLQAMDNFRARSAELGTPIFLILTDDPQWATENLLGDKDEDAFVLVMFQSKDSYDIAFLSMCNHTIIDSVDDIGVVGSLLGHGTVTCTDTNEAVSHGLKKLHNWEFIKLT